MKHFAGYVLPMVLLGGFVGGLIPQLIYKLEHRNETAAIKASVPHIDQSEIIRVKGALFGVAGGLVIGVGIGLRKRKEEEPS